MPSFLVEGYLATPTRAELEALARRAYALEAGEVIRYLGSLVLPEDEVCFHIFEAPSVAAVAEASERAELGHDRVVETVWIPGAPGPEGPGAGFRADLEPATQSYCKRQGGFR